MTIDVECPDCHGHGEVCGVTPSRRSRFVGYDDLSPDDYTQPCPRCLGSGVVDHDLDEDCAEAAAALTADAERIAALEGLLSTVMKASEYDEQKQRHVGWNITRLNKARSLIQAALKGTEND